MRPCHSRTHPVGRATWDNMAGGGRRDPEPPRAGWSLGQLAGQGGRSPQYLGGLGQPAAAAAVVTPSGEELARRVASRSRRTCTLRQAQTAGYGENPRSHEMGGPGHPAEGAEIGWASAGLIRSPAGKERGGTSRSSRAREKGSRTQPSADEPLGSGCIPPAQAPLDRKAGEPNPLAVRMVW